MTQREITDSTMEVREGRTRIKIRLSNDEAKRREQAREAVSTLLETARMVAEVNDLHDPGDKLQAAIGEWAAQTFPGQTNERLLRHLAEEVEELRVVMQSAADTPSATADEIGDGLVLLLALAHRNGLSAVACAEMVHARNRRRRFAYDPLSGYDRHVPDEPVAPVHESEPRIQEAKARRLKAICDMDTSRFVPGQLGKPRYQIDVLVPSLSSAVRVQLTEQAAEAMVRWRNLYGVRPRGPIRENPGLADDDAYLDAVTAAVHAWIAETFPPNFPVIVGSIDL